MSIYLYQIRLTNTKNNDKMNIYNEYDKKSKVAVFEKETI